MLIFFFLGGVGEWNPSLPWPGPPILPAGTELKPETERSNSRIPLGRGNGEGSEHPASSQRTSKGWQSSELSCLFFVWLLQATTYGNNAWFLHSPEEFWIVRNGVHGEGRDGRPCDLGKLNTQNSETAQRASPLGGHRRMLGGGRITS